MAECNKERKRVLCKDQDIESNRSFVNEYLLDLTIMELVEAKPYVTLWESVVIVNPFEKFPYDLMEHIFWLVPKADSGKRTVREVCGLMVVLKDLFPESQTKLELIVCPLSGYVFELFMSLYQSDTEFKRHHNKGYMAEKAKIRRSPWAEEIAQHAYWEQLRILD